MLMVEVLEIRSSLLQQSIHLLLPFLVVHQWRTSARMVIVRSEEEGLDPWSALGQKSMDA
jgi:hypothetical protein